MNITNQKLRDVLKILFLVVWLTAIFYFSSQPGLLPSHDYYELVIRKLFHFSEFAILLFLLFKSISLLKEWMFAKTLGWAAIFSILYAAMDELHQLSIPGRNGSIRDVVIDIFGILVACLLVILEREHQLRYPQQRHFIKI